MKTRHIVFAASLSAAAGLAHANLLSNGSFETQGAVSATNVGEGVSAYFYTVGSNDLPGWSILGSAGAQVHTTTSKPSGTEASLGNFWLDLTGVTGYDKGVAATFSTVIGATYQVSFDLGALKAPGFGSVTAEVLVNGNSAGIFTHTPVTGSGSWQSAGMDWASKSFSFKATGANTTLSFLGRANGALSNANGIALDNVAVVPEPEGYAMALAAIGIVAFSIRRRARQG